LSNFPEWAQDKVNFPLNPWNNRKTSIESGGAGVNKKIKANNFRAVSVYLDGFILLLIVLNILAVVLGTVDDIYKSYKPWFDGFELFSILVFTVEYFIRLAFCVADSKYHHPVKGRLAYAATPLALVDLFAFLPFYLPFLIPFDLRFIRVIRLLRVFRFLKIAHYSKSLHLITEVFYWRRRELAMTFFMGGIVLLMLSCLMFFAEHEAQPAVFSSIPATVEWCVLSLSNMGARNVFPVTAMGKIIGVLLAFFGLGLFALPAGILGSGFVEEIRKEHMDQRDKRMKD
jgi:voltage-gated potassium channel